MDDSRMKRLDHCRLYQLSPSGGEIMSLPRFIVVEELDRSKKLELELEPTKEAPLLLSTLQTQFPTAISLEYRHVVGGAIRSLRMANGQIFQPADGWRNRVFNPVYNEGAKKRKRDDVECLCRSLKRRCEELYVYGFPLHYDGAKLENYFSRFGEVASCVVMKKASAKIGFVRFVDFKSQLKVLTQVHNIESRMICVSMSGGDHNSYERHKSSSTRHTSDSKDYDRRHNRTHSGRSSSPVRTISSLLTKRLYRPVISSIRSKTPGRSDSHANDYVPHESMWRQAMAGSPQMSSTWPQHSPGRDVVGDVKFMTPRRGDSTGSQRSSRHGSAR